MSDSPSTGAVTTGAASLLSLAIDATWKNIGTHPVTSITDPLVIAPYRSHNSTVNCVLNARRLASPNTTRTTYWGPCMEAFVCVRGSRVTERTRKTIGSSHAKFPKNMSSITSDNRATAASHKVSRASVVAGDTNSGTRVSLPFANWTLFTCDVISGFPLTWRAIMRCNGCNSFWSQSH